MREEKEQKIAEIKQALENESDTHYSAKIRRLGPEWLHFLLDERDRHKRMIHNLKRRLKGCEERNRCLGRDQKKITEGIQWIKKRHEEAWTYEPGTGEVVEEILQKIGVREK
nr:hypothetical protein [Aneurinibacillus sp. XH2]